MQKSQLFASVHIIRFGAFFLLFILFGRFVFAAVFARPSVESEFYRSEAN